MELAEINISSPNSNLQYSNTSKFSHSHRVVNALVDPVSEESTDSCDEKPDKIPGIIIETHINSENSGDTSGECEMVTKAFSSSSGSEPEIENSDDWDNWEGLKGRPERWAPLGANDSDKEYSTCGPLDEGCPDPSELKKVKDDQEQLTSALLALTSHFAQVQFRVSQIVEAPQDEKESLLKDLKDFAFRGIPSAVTERLASGGPGLSCEGSPLKTEENIREKMRIQREKQKDLILQLKNQLEELESYAYETGEAGLPQSVILERHKLVIEQLKDRLNLNVDELERLSDDDLKDHLDQAISELVNPMIMKEQLVTQLKTQITDLERFIHFLHAGGDMENIPEGLLSTSGCKCARPTSGRSKNSKIPGKATKINMKKPNNLDTSELKNEEELRARTIQLMKKALTLIQMFAMAQFGCNSVNSFHINAMKQNAKGAHWGDLRARLEIVINRVYNLAMQSDVFVDSEYLSDSEDSPTINCNQALTTAVRKDLSSAIAELLEHGLMPVGQSQSLVPFVSCFAARNSANGKPLTAWDLILKFYQIKNGEKYNSTPARRLSQSFGLEIVGSVTITNKQLLLSAIDNIMRSHTRYKRSPEAQFKAFICHALNSNKLVIWLRLIIRCQILVESYYQPWSYVAKTGFEDTLRSLDKLSSIDFDLPVDLAIRQFQNIKDAFQ